MKNDNDLIALSLMYLMCKQAFMQFIATDSLYSLNGFNVRYFSSLTAVSVNFANGQYDRAAIGIYRLYLFVVHSARTGLPSLLLPPSHCRFPFPNRLLRKRDHSVNRCVDVITYNFARAFFARFTII